MDRTNLSTKNTFRSSIDILMVVGNTVLTISAQKDLLEEGTIMNSMDTMVRGDIPSIG